MESEPTLALDMSHATPELFAALAKAQGEIEDASKNKKNDHLKSRYADLAEVMGEIRPPFSKNGLALSQWPTRGLDNSVVVTTIVTHATGGYIQSSLSVQPAQAGPQAVGAAITYLRRFSAAAAAGISQEDDDGESDFPQRSATQQRAVEDAEQRRNGPRPPQRRQPDQQRAAPHDQQQEVDDATASGPYSPDLSPSAISMARNKAAAAGLDDAGVAERFGAVTTGNINKVLADLRSMADKAPE